MHLLLLLPLPPLLLWFACLLFAPSHFMLLAVSQSASGHPLLSS